MSFEELNRNNVVQQLKGLVERDEFTGSALLAYLPFGGQAAATLRELAAGS